MNLHPLYTTGYAGRRVEAFKAIVDAKDAIVADVRFSPRSQMPGWNGYELARIFGDRYVHVPEMGNRNHSTAGGIDIADAPQGVVKMARLARQASVIAICGCRDLATCHRRVVAELMRPNYREFGAGVDAISELEWPTTPAPAGRQKCISLWQPWGWLCVAIDPATGRAEKEHETRSWPVSYRGPLLIHAAKRWDGENSYMVNNPHFRAAWARHFLPSQGKEEMGLGAIIGQVEMVDCLPTGDWCDALSSREQAFGDFSSDRFAWKFQNPVRFETPIPWRGSQGMFEVDVAEMERAREVAGKVAHQPQVLAPPSLTRPARKEKPIGGEAYSPPTIAEGQLQGALF